ncbi:hypothetical protein N007_05555 [Alicyclobacillus acidoterrestris ATCC 49025]|nr:hypothetical protein N007_05555 [Alicyclobacillus acidoterrestris ATCC 49025]
MILQQMIHDFTYCWSHWSYPTNLYKMTMIAWVGAMAWLVRSRKTTRGNV